MATVLIVDDEEAYRKHLRTTMIGAGHAVQTAEDGHSAIAAAEESCPDVLVVDWMLKGHAQGLEVAGRLREMDPELVTILITGYPSEQQEAAARQFGLFASFIKPFDLDDILDAVCRATTPAAR